VVFYTIFQHRLVGRVLLVTDGAKLIRSSYVDSKLAPKIEKAWKRDPRNSLLVKAVSQLNDYLAGKRSKLTVPLQIDGTKFQKQVYGLVLKIPVGAVTSYQELARKLGKPLASRSVGAAIGKNPLLIFVPDHRVINRSGQTGGFAGKWSRKPGLLKLESQIAERSGKNVPRSR
jgi:methylated-DNA-[protein]-cysteine S-methyltransferase